MTAGANRPLEEELYDELVKSLLARVRTGEASAAELGVVRQFLKDNSISADKDKHPQLGALAKSLPFPAGESKVY